MRGWRTITFDKWFEQVREHVLRRLRGDYHISLPISVPRGLSPIVFGDALLETIEREEAALARDRRMSLAFEIAGVRVLIGQMPIQRGNSIGYARFMSDMREFPALAKKCLDDKAPKLKQYSDEGIETHIVIYNTMGVPMSPVEAENMIRAQCGPEHAHVTHISVVAGMPPDDGWVQVVR